jgi:uncharacterized membrane protein
VNWVQLALFATIAAGLFAALWLLERWNRRTFRQALAENARRRWEILQSMPEGEQKRAAVLHACIAEITDDLWDEL